MLSVFQGIWKKNSQNLKQKEKNDVFIQDSATSEKLQIDNPKQEIVAVGMEQYEFGYRKVSKLNFFFRVIERTKFHLKQRNQRFSHTKKFLQKFGVLGWHFLEKIWLVVFLINDFGNCYHSKVIF